MRRVSRERQSPAPIVPVDRSPLLPGVDGDDGIVLDGEHGGAEGFAEVGTFRFPEADALGRVGELVD